MPSFQAAVWQPAGAVDVDAAVRKATASAVECGLRPVSSSTAVRDASADFGEDLSGKVVCVKLVCEQDGIEPPPSMLSAFAPEELLDVALDSGPAYCARVGRHTFTPVDSERLRKAQDASATCQVCGEDVTALSIATAAGLAWCACGTWEEAALVRLGCVHGD